MYKMKVLSSKKYRNLQNFNINKNMASCEIYISKESLKWENQTNLCQAVRGLQHKKKTIVFEQLVMFG